MTTITALPPAPSRADPVNFADTADTWVAALPTFGSQVNTVATEINTSATNAANSASAAATSATNAANSASAAATSASNASTSASSASTSASNALTSANNAAASFDSFDDRYLGSKASDPTLDNDGNALLTGALYWNSTSSEMRVYTGSAWVAAYLPAGSYVTLSGNQTIGGVKTFSSTIVGTIDNATKLATARTINGVAFDGTANITVPAATANAVTFNNAGTGAVSGTTYDGSVARTISYNTIGAPSVSGTNATGTWGISISGNAATATSATSATTASSCSGNSATAATFQTARTINGVSFNGSANITITAQNPNAVTFTNAAGAAAGSVYDGGSILSVGYNTVGAPSATGANASGTWGISITGNAASVTNGVYTTGDQTIGGNKTFTGNSIFRGNATLSDGTVRGYLYSDATGAGFLSSGSAWAARVDFGTTNWTVIGDITAYSDERLKKNWRNVQDNFVYKLSLVKSGVYDRTDQEITQAGVSAQSLQEVLPEAVNENSDGVLSVSYGNAALVAAVELAKEVTALKQELLELKKLLQEKKGIE